MRTLPNIKLTTKELNNLINKNYFDCGGESVIGRSPSSTSLYKIFVDHELSTVIEMPEAKLEKISRQFAQPLEHSVQPLATLEWDGTLVGYEMTYDPKDKSLFSLKLSRRRLIAYLNQIKEILEYYKRQGIVYGDLKSDNILINSRTHKITFCDMDNVQMQEIPIDLEGLDLSRFRSPEGLVSPIAHAYLHNVLSVQELVTDKYAPDKLAQVIGTSPTIPGFKKDAEPIFRSMHPFIEFNGEYAIEYVKRIKPLIVTDKTWK